MIQLLLRIKYEIEKAARNIRKAISNSSKEFTPLPIRDSNTLSRADYLYSLKLQYARGWISRYSNSLDETISVLLTDKKRKKLFKKLIKKFVYVDNSYSNELALDIVSYINDVWRCDPNDSVVMAIRKVNNLHPDGSVNLVYKLEAELKDWKSSRFINAFDLDNKYIKNCKNIILCDDFIGTGGTYEKRIVAVKKILTAKQQLYVVSLAGMQEAKTNVIDKYSVKTYTPLWLERGLNHDENDSECKTMLVIEDLLADNYKDYNKCSMSLGYKKSGGLYYNEDYRIPNNVYPLFWWGKLKNGEAFNSIFLRS